MTLAERAILILAAVVAFLLQMFLAPHIAIGYAVPNFMVCICMVAAVVRARDFGYVLPFVMGLLFDLISGGPVGVMAFCLTAFSAGSAWFYDRANNDTSFMMLLTLAVGLFLVEIAYGTFNLLFGYAANPLEALVFRTLPCYLFDLVISVIGCLVVSRLSSGGATVQPEIKQLQ